MADARLEFTWPFPLSRMDSSDVVEWTLVMLFRGQGNRHGEQNGYVFIIMLVAGGTVAGCRSWRCERWERVVARGK
jgi:hypothetical protein